MDDRLGASLAFPFERRLRALNERMTPPRCALRSVQRRCRAPPSDYVACCVSSTRRISTRGGETRISLNPRIQLPVSSLVPTPRSRN